VNGQPSTLSLKEMLEVYLEHRLEVVRRRSSYRLGKATDRLHLVDGLLIAILDIDDVIAIIRGSEDAAQARTRLMEAFELTETQTNYILDMQLRRLTKFSKIELEAEREQLLNTIADLQAILDSPERQREVVARELDEVARAHGTPRRTVLLAAAGTAVTATAAPLEVADDPCWVLLSSAGLLARTDTAEALPSTGPRAVHDVIVSAARTTARGEYGAITSAGRLIRCQAIDLPSVPVTATAPSLKGGSVAGELVELASGERILATPTAGRWARPAAWSSGSTRRS
jgi:DNA gyrase subunit A